MCPNINASRVNSNTQKKIMAKCKFRCLMNIKFFLGDEKVCFQVLQVRIEIRDLVLKWISIHPKFEKFRIKLTITHARWGKIAQAAGTMKHKLKNEKIL